MLDLEDAVAADDKASARNAIATWLQGATPADRSRIVVRINDAGSPWFAADLATLGDVTLISVLLPKAESAAQVTDTQAALPDAGILALIESARGVAEVNRIAAAGAQRLVFGTLDFALDLDMDISTDGSGLSYAASRIAIASRLAIRRHRSQASRLNSTTRNACCPTLPSRDGLVSAPSCASTRARSSRSIVALRPSAAALTGPGASCGRCRITRRCTA